MNGVGPGEAEIDASDNQPSDGFGGYDEFMAQSPPTTVRVPTSVAYKSTISQQFLSSLYCGFAQAGWERWVTLELRDQFGAAYQKSGLNMEDSIAIGSPNDLNIGSAETGNEDTDANGTWPDQYYVCSSECPGTGQTNASQSWSWDTVELQNENTIVYKCSSITVDGN